MNIILDFFILFWSAYYIIHIIIFGYKIYQENYQTINHIDEDYEKELEDLILRV